MCYSRAVIIIIPLVTSLTIFLSIIFFISQGSCPQGHFPCADHKICIKQRYICDGHEDCPAGEDEDPLNCADLHGGFWALVDNLKNYTGPPNNTCVLDKIPDDCDCTDLTVVMCSGLSLRQIPLNISQSATSLIFGNNNIELRSNDFKKYSLQIIYLGENKISFLPKTIFHGQGNLKKLFLFGNDLQEIPKEIFDGLHSLSWLLIYNNRISTIHLDDWNLKNLTWLDLSNNQLKLANQNFPSLPSLILLYLDRNLIEEICSHTFSQLPSLKDLSLGFNQIKYIHPSAFKRNYNIQELNLRNNHLTFLHEDLFHSTKNLQKLILGGNIFLLLEPNLFLPLRVLRSLDLRNIDIMNISPEMFSELKKLDFVYFKRFRYCTYVSQAPKCFPLSDGSSSVSDLLASNFLRVTLWLVALFTLLTNGLVLWHRLTFPSYSSPLNSLITSLASSDLLMGVYLIVIGFQDLRFKGNYMAHARQWMSSWFCTTAGLIATVSSEVSVLMLLLISAERYLLIAAPLSQQKSLKPSVAKLSVIVVWIFGFMISTLPVIYWRGTMTFYGTNSFCFPLHIDDPFLIGWQYSAGVFLGLNGFGLIGITFLYLGVFLSIRKTRRATTLNIRDSEFAFRFFIIVLANVCCWVPIIILKILALMNIEFSGELYGWLAVFVLPINSAINPILYTFSIPNHRPSTEPGDRQQGNEFKLKRRFSKAISLNRQFPSYDPPKTGDEQF